MLLCVKYETLTSQLEDAAAAACHRKQQPKKKNFTTKNFIHKNLSNSFFTIFIRTPISEYLLALYCFSLEATFCQEEDVVLRLIPRRSRDFHDRRNWVARDAEQKDDFPFYPQSSTYCLPTGIYSSFVLAYIVSLEWLLNLINVLSTAWWMAVDTDEWGRVTF